MNPTLLTDLEILKALSDCEGFLLPAEALVEQARMALRPPRTLAEIRERILHLESQRAIIGVSNEYGIKYKLADAGRARLMEMTTP